MLKRIFSTAILTTMAFILAHAQFNYGIKGGLNLSTISTNYATGYTWKPAYHLGVSVDYAMTKRFYATGDLFYSDKGFANKNNNNKSIHFAYISLPFAVGYTLIPKISVEAGGGINYLLSSYVNLNGKPSTIADIWGNKLDIELCAGVRYSLRTRFSISARYEYGLSNVIARNSTVEFYDQNSPDPQSSSTLRGLGWKSYNRNFQLSVRYTFQGQPKN